MIPRAQRIQNGRAPEKAYVRREPTLVDHRETLENTGEGRRSVPSDPIESRE